MARVASVFYLVIVRKLERAIRVPPPPPPLHSSLLLPSQLSRRAFAWKSNDKVIYPIRGKQCNRHWLVDMCHLCCTAFVNLPLQTPSDLRCKMSAWLQQAGTRGSHHHRHFQRHTVCLNSKKSHNLSGALDDQMFPDTSELVSQTVFQSLYFRSLLGLDNLKVPQNSSVWMS